MCMSAYSAVCRNEEELFEVSSVATLVSLRIIVTQCGWREGGRGGGERERVRYSNFLYTELMYLVHVHVHACIYVLVHVYIQCTLYMCMYMYMYIVPCSSRAVSRVAVSRSVRTRLSLISLHSWRA